MKPTVYSSQILYEGFLHLRKDMLVRPDGQMHDFTCIDIPSDAVVVLAQDPDGRFILNREYRHPTGQFILGCPGGCLEKEESPLAGGERELLEETGYKSENFKFLGCCYPIPGICSQKIYFIYTQNAVLGPGQKLEPFEFIETVLKTEEELKREILSGELIDGLLCTALWYKSLISC